MNLESFSGQDFFPGIHRGLVVAVDDPLQAGRVRVLVYDFMNKLLPADYDGIPWAVPATTITAGSSLNLGTFAVPDLNSEVFVFFEGQSIYQPVYFAEAPCAVKGLPLFRSVSYPNRMGFAVASFQFYIDKVTGDISAIQTGGVQIAISPTTGISVVVPTGDVSITATTGNISLTAGTEVSLSAPLVSASAASGSFISEDSQTITVTNGIITAIV
jgi:hypothetical protein